MRVFCPNGWIVLCPHVRKGKYDSWIYMVLISKYSKDVGILPKLDWKYQVVLNLIFELLASHWKVIPNGDIMNLINLLDGIKWILCNIPNLINQRILVKRGLWRLIGIKKWFCGIRVILIESEGVWWELTIEKIHKRNKYPFYSFYHFLKQVRSSHLPPLHFHAIPPLPPSFQHQFLHATAIRKSHEISNQAKSRIHSFLLLCIGRNSLPLNLGVSMFHKLWNWCLHVYSYMNSSSWVMKN
jgi:hypothetical protein